MIRQAKGLFKVSSLAALLLFCLSVSALIFETVAQDEFETPTGQGPKPCTFKTNDGKIIDLSALDGKDGKPRFNGTSVVDNKNYYYSYNPCTPFTDNTDAHHQDKCANVYACQTLVTDIGTSFAVADTLSGISQDTNKKYYLGYSGKNRIVKVYLDCHQGTEGKITSISQTDETDGITTDYNFQLSSCHACPGGCVDKNIAGVVGIVILCLILVAVVAYFIIGAILMKYRYQATGTDIIPNKGFWGQLPFLIKDGCVFTFSPCVNLIRGNKNDYQKI